VVHYFLAHVPIGIVLVPWRGETGRVTWDPERLDVREHSSSVAAPRLVLGLVRGTPVVGPVRACSLLVIGAVLLAASSGGNCALRPDAEFANVQNRGSRDQCARSCSVFGMFGTVFFLSQFLQTVQATRPRRGTSSFAVDRQPMLLAPVVGLLASASAVSLVVTGSSSGLSLMWLACCDADDAVLGHGSRIIVAGVGMTLFSFGAVALLGSVRRSMKALSTTPRSCELGGSSHRAARRVLLLEGDTSPRRITSRLVRMYLEHWSSRSSWTTLSYRAQEAQRARTGFSNESRDPPPRCARSPHGLGAVTTND